jgi:hypothetical protein
MKNKIAIILATLALFAGIYNYLTIQKHCKPKEEADKSEHNGRSEEAHGTELADYMNKFQRYANKLWFAGNNQNWPLAQFYIHELEESMIELEHANPIEDGIELSPLIRNFGLKPLERIENAVENKETKAFDEAYDLMISNCNNCHHATKHEFIIIQKPLTPAYDNQHFLPADL